MMMKTYFSIFFSIAILLLFSGCISPFEPKGASVEGLLVVEGDIVLNDTTVITLSRSSAISSNQTVKYVFNATVWVESSEGIIVYGIPKLSNGVYAYKIPTSGLNRKAMYRLKVRIPGSGEYESPFMSVLETPDIENISWKVDSLYHTVTFYVSSKGSDIASNYYRWNYSEDWEFTARYNTYVYYDEVRNKIIDTALNWYYCYKKDVSKGVYVANTSGFSENKVYNKPIATFGNHDDRLSVLYSMEVTQRSLTREGYIYWENIGRNSSELGGIFSPQPSEVRGNITSLSNPNEVVLGYISAVVTKKKRIFAYAKDIKLFSFNDDCSIIENVPLGSFLEMKRSGYELLGYDELEHTSLWTMKKCVDCRLSGSKLRPSFWPLNHY